MLTDIHQILSNFKHSSTDMEEIRCLKLGSSFFDNATVRKMMNLLERYGLSVPDFLAAESLETKHKTTLSLSKKAGFYLFILLFNKHFDLTKKELLKGTELKLKNLSKELGIDALDYDSILQFYTNNKPYQDHFECAYMAFESANQLIRSRGINVYFNHKNPGEIVYLKYFKAYNLLLSKTFIITGSYNLSAEKIRVKEINLVDEKNYDTFNYKVPAFKALKNEITNFDPLQHVEVNETIHNPQITLDPSKCIISISGTSSPVSTSSYFEPIFEWLKIFDTSNKKTLSIYLDFKYFNTYTAKFLLNLVLECNGIYSNGKKVSFYWYYDEDDDEMKEFGEHLMTQFTEKEKFYVLENNNVI